MLRLWVSIDLIFQNFAPVKAGSVYFEEEDDPVNGLLENLWRERNHIEVAEEAGDVVGYFVQLSHRSLVVGAESAPNETLKKWNTLVCVEGSSGIIAISKGRLLGYCRRANRPTSTADMSR